ncbi:MAG TPA: hypothetical protein VHG08_03340 [Longimicrobium sp.]|nr:hypothetical protein [Longimicrobium sp.]
MGTGRWLAVCAAAVLAAVPAALPAQQTPEQVVQAYYGHYRAGELDRVVALTHPRSLEAFKSSIGRFMAFAGDEEDSPFGEMGDLESLPADSAYLVFMQGAGQEEEEYRELFGALQVQPLGHVLQGDSVAHVVFEASTELSGVSAREVMVITLRRQGSQWLVDPGGNLLDMVAGGMMPLLMRAGMEAGMSGMLDDEEDHDH